MLTFLRKRVEENEEGFTLIELMVVVLIIGILVAIAIPTFLGAQDRARDRGAQSDIRNAVTAAKTIATDSAGSFSNVDDTTLETAEGALDFGDTASETVLGVRGGNMTATANDDLIQITKISASGRAFSMVAASTGEVTYCKGTDASPGTVTNATWTAAGGIAGCADTSWND